MVFFLVRFAYNTRDRYLHEEYWNAKREMAIEQWLPKETFTCDSNTDTFIELCYCWDMEFINCCGQNWYANESFQECVTSQFWTFMNTSTGKNQLMAWSSGTFFMFTDKPSDAQRFVERQCAWIDKNTCRP